jgi:hypothetical protein
MDCQKTKAANDMPKYVATFTILDPYSSSFFASIQFQNQIDFVLHFFVEEELRWEGKVNCETVSIGLENTRLQTRPIILAFGTAICTVIFYLLTLTIFWKSYFHSLPFL